MCVCVCVHAMLGEAAACLLNGKAKHISIN